MQSPSERINKGLSPQGNISISAHITDGKVQLILKDDGRGLNLGKLREIALQKKLIAIEQANDPEVLAALIFQPEVSTSNTVTDVSGRGIGMAAVVEELREAGGGIEIQLDQTRRVDAGFVAFGFLIALPLSLFHY
ncbi:MAG: hypothetical protein M3Q07_01930 [Pseudobdellovibrionaceae bacterium]|nr:hypothetical protein [Pseudobdellovibrionaceae bacterium]